MSKARRRHRAVLRRKASHAGPPPQPDVCVRACGVDEPLSDAPSVSTGDTCGREIEIEILSDAEGSSVSGDQEDGMKGDVQRTTPPSVVRRSPPGTETAAALGSPADLTADEVHEIEMVIETLLLAVAAMDEDAAAEKLLETDIEESAFESAHVRTAIPWSPRLLCALVRL